MGKDKCVICGAPAHRMLPVANFVEFDCQDCRNYAINEDILRALVEDGRSFNVERTRTYLESERVDGRAPTITRLETVLHDLLGPITIWD
ncbi:hypothetical protein GCM10009504_40460 [Pseudomonas laurentiana]|nr:hypothetical protein GCM10009504_40460 [Pseudomonas laurentiana]